MVDHSMNTKGGTSAACAACKFQRKKCSKDCPLAPYFPPNEPTKFLCVHRLFGVGNVLKILKQVSDDKKDDAMTSITYEAQIRATCKVNGCVDVIRTLDDEIKSTCEQLRQVCAQIAYCKQQGAAQGGPDYSSPSNLQLAINNNVNQDKAPYVMPDEFYFNGNIYDKAIANLNFIEQSRLHDHQSFKFEHGESSMLNDQSLIKLEHWESSRRYIPDMNEEMASLNINHENGFFGNRISIQQNFLIQPQEVPLDVPYYDDGIRQSFIGKKDASDSSVESSMKETTRRVTENDLKTAAKCFSLTSINDSNT